MSGQKKVAILDPMWEVKQKHPYAPPHPQGKGREGRNIPTAARLWGAQMQLCEAAKSHLLFSLEKPDRLQSTYFYRILSSTPFPSSIWSKFLWSILTITQRNAIKEWFLNMVQTTKCPFPISDSFSELFLLQTALESGALRSARPTTEEKHGVHWHPRKCTVVKPGKAQTANG